jgi:hypothetical protein
VSTQLGWQPQRGPREIVRDIAEWLRRGEAELAGLFA